MKLGAPAQTKREGVTMEEAGLKRAIDEARTAFAREARAATNITLKRKYLIVPVVRVGAAFRKNLLPQWKSDRRYLDEYIAENPDSTVAKAKADYDAAYSAWKEYLYRNKTKPEADGEVCREVTTLILERRKSALQGGMERFIKNHPIWSAVIAGVTLAALGPLIAQVVTIPAALAALGVGLGGRMVVAPVFLKWIKQTQSSDPEVAGRAMANWQYSSNWFWFIAAMAAGLYVRVAGAENAVVALTGMSQEKAHALVHTRLGAVIGTDNLIGSVEAAPSHIDTGPAGVITPQEASFINDTLKPYRNASAYYGDQIRALQEQRNGFLARARANPGISIRDAQSNFDSNLDLLKESAKRGDTLLKNAQAQLEFVARKPFDPQYPTLLQDEASVWSPQLRNFFGMLNAQYENFASYVKTARTQFVESSFKPPVENSRVQGAQFETVAYVDNADAIRTPADYDSFIQTEVGRAKHALDMLAEKLNRLWTMSGGDARGTLRNNFTNLHKEIIQARFALDEFARSTKTPTDISPDNLRARAGDFKNTIWAIEHQAENDVDMFEKNLGLDRV